MSRKKSGLWIVSLLDIFACGLGAAVLLGLILMIVRQRPPVERSPSSGLMLRVTIEDSKALLALVLKNPRGEWFETDLRELESGVEKECRGARCTVLGFSQSGTTRLEALPNDPGRSFIVHLRDPEKGKWGVGIRYFNRDVPEDDWSRWENEAGRRVRLERFELFRSKDRKPQNYCASKEPLALGAVAMCEVEIVPEGTD
jgi:hypothetical protein